VTGTITDLDPDALVGLLDADDGRMLFFNLRALQPGVRAQFKVGTRVNFMEECDALAPRAIGLAVHNGSCREP